MPLLTASDKALWRLALPMILSNITVPLLGLVDTAVIGHLDSPVYLGGVAIGATATSFLFMLLLFLRMSTTGLTAQAFGAKKIPLHSHVRLSSLCCWRSAQVSSLRCCVRRLSTWRCILPAAARQCWSRRGASLPFAG